MKPKPNLISFLPLIVFVFIFLGLVIRDLKLATLPFYDWDEALYAQIGAEIIKNKSLVTTFNGQLWFDKPPLLHGLVATVFLVIGRSEFWARSLMIVFSMGLLVLLYLLTKQVLDNLFKDKLKKMSVLYRQLAYLLPTLIVGLTSLFVEKSLLINTDIIIAVSWLGYFLFRERFYPKLLFLLLGVWSKSVFGFYPLFFEALALRRKDFNLKNALQFFLLLALSSVWYVFNYFQFGDFFIKAHFLDQVLKRVVVPIELHFGGKFYYFEFLWSNLGLILALIVAGYIFISWDFLKLLFKEKFAILKSRKWWFYLLLFSPFPFFIFITLIRTKLYWYLTMLIPLLALAVSYLFVKVENKTIRALIFIFVAVYFLYNFVPQTYTLRAANPVPTKVELAKCLSQKEGKTLAFLTDIQERKNQNFLEAAHYDTTASFYYGGSPAFVFYSQKEIGFFYNVDKFVQDYQKFDIVVLPRESLTKDKQIQENRLIRERVGDLIGYCNTADWLAFPK